MTEENDLDVQHQDNDFTGTMSVNEAPVETESETQEEKPKPKRSKRKGSVDTKEIVLQGARAGQWVDTETGITFVKGQPKRVDADVADRLLEREGSNGQLFEEV